MDFGCGVGCFEGFGNVLSLVVGFIQLLSGV